VLKRGRDSGETMDVHVVHENPYFIPSTALLKAFGRLKDVYPDMTLLQAMFLFYIAQNPDTSLRRIYRSLDTSDGSGSRLLALLSDVGLRDAPGLELVTVRVPPEDRRARLVQLSPKGRRLMSDIAGDLRWGSEGGLRGQ
jgi:DNA-binding MarR family transcriptional regulator